MAPIGLPTEEVVPTSLPTEEVAPNGLPTEEVTPTGLQTEEVAPTGLTTEDAATSSMIGLEEERTGLRSDEAGVFESFELVITCGLPKEILIHVANYYSFKTK